MLCVFVTNYVTSENFIMNYKYLYFYMFCVARIVRMRIDRKGQVRAWESYIAEKESLSSCVPWKLLFSIRIVCPSCPERFCIVYPTTWKF